MQKTNNLQEIFLTQVRRERRQVTVFLMNGFQMRGQVTGFDAFTLVLTTDGKQQVIYKHAISTIVPERPVPLTGASLMVRWYRFPFSNADFPVEIRCSRSISYKNIQPKIIGHM